MDHTVGDLAKRSGLTVRTLHHYEQLGLLIPSGRSEAGYRLYADADVLTLHRILAYRQMGLALKDIAPLLAPDSAPPLLEILERQISLVRVQLEQQRRLLTTLERVAARAKADDASGPEMVDELLQLMNAQRILERWYSQDEIDRLRALQDSLGTETLAHVKTEVAELLPAMRAAMQAGEAPDTPRLLDLARRWIAVGRLVSEDETLRDKGRAMLRHEPAMRQMSGLDPALMAYIDRAIDAAKAEDGEAVGASEDRT